MKMLRLHPVQRREAPRRKLGRFIAMMCAVGTLFLSAQGLAASPDPEFEIPTLLDAIDLALINGPDMASAQKTVEQAQIGSLAARSALSWRVDAAGSHSQMRDVEDGTDDSQTAASLTLQRTFTFDPAVANQLRQADLGAEQTLILLERTAYETVATVFEAYRQLELALIQRQMLAESVRVAQMGLDVAMSRSETETLAKEDAEEARLDLVAAQLEYDASERMLDIARLILAQRLGIDDLPTVDEVPVPSLDELKDAIASGSAEYWPERPIPWPATLEELQMSAVANRPEVRLAHARVRQSEIDVEQARLARRPVFFTEAKYTKPLDGDVSVSLNSRGGLSATLNVYEPYDLTKEQLAHPPASNDQWEVRIGASVNLWDSAQSAIEVERASSALRQATSDWEQAKSGVELDVANRHINAVTAHRRLRLQSERTLLALDRLAAEQRRLELGLATPLSVAAKELEVHGAVVQTYAARVEYEKSVVDLAVSVGLAFDELRELIRSYETPVTPQHTAGQP